MELSASIRERISEGFEEYGLTIPQFYISDVILSYDDPNFKRMKEHHTIAVQTKMTEVEATLTATHRKITTEEQETEIARREAERKLIAAQAEVQKAYAEVSETWAQAATEAAVWSAISSDFESEWRPQAM